MSDPKIIVVQADQLYRLVNEAVITALRSSEIKTSAKASANSEKPDLVTRQKAAEMLQVSLTTVDNYIRDGLLTKKRIGIRSVRLDRSAVEKLARTA